LTDEARKPGSHTWIKEDKHRQQLLQAKSGDALTTHRTSA
jgi:NADH:ubiquinone reductase (H+-translocating)